MIPANDQGTLDRDFDARGELRQERLAKLGRTALWVVVSGVCYYLATQIAWALCFHNSKVSLLFPPHAVLIAVLLVVPGRHWWAYTLAAVCAHFIATQQAHWPLSYSLQCEAFDAAKAILTAAGIRRFLKYPLELTTLRDAVVFVLIAVVIVPFGTAFWGAAFTIQYGFGSVYWVEWRNLGLSNGVTTIVLVPGILVAMRYLSTRRMGIPPWRLLEVALLGAGLLTMGVLVFHQLPTGTSTSLALIYAPVPLLIWAALRFGHGGICAALLCVTIQAIWGTMQGRGPFLAQTPAENAVALQSFLVVMAIPLLFLAVMVQEEKHSRKALEESEERYREVVESQTELVCRYLADSTLTFVNDASCRAFGRRRDEVLGRKLHEFIPLSAGAVFANHLAGPQGAQSGETEEFEVALPGDRTVWYLWKAYPIAGPDGRLVEFQAIGHDITDRKRAEEARQNLAHATRVSTLGILAGSLAHELNQPLTAILNNAQADLRLLAEPAPNFAEIQEGLKDIVQDTKRAGDIIRQLRGFIKKDEKRFEALDMNHLVHDVARLIHSDAVGRHVEIELACHGDETWVRGDGVQLRQVMLNLLLNAFDAMKDVAQGGRTVRIRTMPTDREALQVEVCDCGTGIHPERLARLFEPFLTTKREGLGLGLSISRSIVEAHGGRLWAANNPQRGATFYFTVPMHSVPSNPA